jgi:hypothetical protein
MLSESGASPWVHLGWEHRSPSAEEAKVIPN